MSTVTTTPNGTPEDAADRCRALGCDLIAAHRSVDGSFVIPISGPAVARVHPPTGQSVAQGHTESDDSVLILRGRFWDEQFTLVDPEDIVVNDVTTGDTGIHASPSTLSAFVSRYLGGSSTDGAALELSSMSSVCRIRYQAVFVPHPSDEALVSMEVLDLARRDGYDPHMHLFLDASSGQPTVLLPSSLARSPEVVALGMPTPSSCDAWSPVMATARNLSGNLVGPNFLLQAPLPFVTDKHHFGQAILENATMLIQIPVNTLPAQTPGTLGTQDETTVRSGTGVQPSVDRPCVEGIPLQAHPVHDTATVGVWDLGSASNSSSDWEELTEDLPVEHQGPLPAPEAVENGRSASADGEPTSGICQKPADHHVDCEVGSSSVTRELTQCQEQSTFKVILDDERRPLITVNLFFPSTVPPESAVPLLRALTLAKPLPSNLLHSQQGCSGALAQKEMRCEAQTSPPPEQSRPPKTLPPPRDSPPLSEARSLVNEFLCSNYHQLRERRGSGAVLPYGPVCDICHSNLGAAPVWLECRRCNFDICLKCCGDAQARAAVLRNGPPPVGKPSSRVVVRRAMCRQGHGLMNLAVWWGSERPFPPSRFVCDVCRSCITVAANGFCCRACNYDVCHGCLLRRTVSLEVSLPTHSTHPAPHGTTRAQTTAAGYLVTPANNPAVVHCRKTCPGSHGLSRYDPPVSNVFMPHRICDVCSERMSSKLGGYYCRTCDYDLCERCYLKAPACNNHALSPRPVNGREVCARCSAVVSGSGEIVYDCGCRLRNPNFPHVPCKLCQTCFLIALV